MQSNMTPEGDIAEGRQFTFGADEDRRRSATYKADDSNKEMLNLINQLKRLEEQINSGTASAEQIAEKNKLQEELSRAETARNTENLNILSENLKEYALKQLKALQDTVEREMTQFLQTQQIMAYGLQGTQVTLNNVADELNSVLNGVGIVSQQKVYENLAKLVQAGIVYNAEQRAYLQTLSDDLGMAFQADNANLTRLINIQREDLSANRMAIEYSLHEFLQQNYATSQYIKEGFQSVSDALFEAQSLMQSSQAMELEATVQKWMGSLSSLGMSTSTITSLAQAIGYLGSGQYQKLAQSNMQNLLVYGLTKTTGAGYGELLEMGLSDESADKLIQGIVEALREFANNESNIVKSAYADVFGVTVSDLVAAAHLNTQFTEQSEISTDINNLLNQFDSFIYGSTKVQNLLNNMVYGMATQLASDEGWYMTYKTINWISDQLSSILSGVQVAPFGVGADLGEVASAIGDLTVLIPIVNSLTGITSGITAGKLDYDSVAQSIFDRLGYSKLTNGRQMFYSTQGNILGYTRTSGQEQSASLQISTDADEAAKQLKKSSGAQVEQLTAEDQSTKNTAENIASIKEALSPGGGYYGIVNDFFAENAVPYFEKMTSHDGPDWSKDLYNSFTDFKTWFTDAFTVAFSKDRTWPVNVGNVVKTNVGVSIDFSKLEALNINTTGEESPVQMILKLLQACIDEYTGGFKTTSTDIQTGIGAQNSFIGGSYEESTGYIRV